MVQLRHFRWAVANFKWPNDSFNLGTRTVSQCTGSNCLAMSRASSQFHSGYTHREPPHYAYRGDGLPDIKCAEIQNLVHMNDRILASGKVSPLRQAKHPLREAECFVEGNAIEVYQDLMQLHDRILTSEWHDSSYLCMNADIWLGALDEVKKRAHDLSDMQVQIALSKTLEIFDVLFKVEDVQDHIFELIEEVTHDGAQAVDNINQHIQVILERYKDLKEKHPRYATKIDESIGYSLALLRQRFTFSWPMEHEYFY
ncbi:hypothetical protein BdWA1_003166 [Babesia duncani]|uniref:DUF6827 domain-containing protein n=1 Tax=Babesia duncani TaxID=323732 RepID=A0AAD9PH57_9APIC|nr:hypothetical protein BdWA1_003748 [Babesia duncani]KAK2195490.1 hypothetical protein BdWA1_003166 [Babesia duncani]